MVHPIFNASMTAAILGYVFIVANEIIFFNWKWEILYLSLVVVPLYFIISAIFVAILFFPLKSLKHHTPLLLSLLAFAFLGFAIPCYLSYQLSWVSSHGQNPYSGDERIHAIFANISFGVIGMISSIVAWKSINDGSDVKIT